MHPFVRGLCVVLGLAAASDSRAKVVELAGIGHDLAVDPVRRQVYVSIPSLNEIDVVSLDSFTVTRRVVVGSGPRGLDLSADGRTLYVALNGAGSIVALGLDTLQPREIVVATQLGDSRAWDVVEASPGRVIVSANPSSSGFAYLVEVRTDQGDAQKRVAGGTIIRAAPPLVRSPDGLSLYVGENFSPNALYKLDLSSAAAPIALQASFGSVSGANYFAISPDSTRLALSSGQVLRAGSLIQAGVTASGLPVFSPDGQTIYVAALNSTSSFPQTAGPGQLTAYSTTTFLKLSQKALPTSFVSLTAIALVPNSTDYLILGNDLLALDGTGVSAPAITSATSATATVGQPFSYQIAANNLPTSFGATGLPAGLTVSAGGLISGTPQLIGNTLVSVTATNSGGTTTATFGLNVLAPAPGRLINISSRCFVSAQSPTVFAGFAVGGSQAHAMLLRVVGPTLAGYGVTDALADPRMQVYNSAGALIGSNDNWQIQSNPVAVSTAAAASGAFPLPVGSKDAALIMTLNPGNYSFTANSVDSTSGSVLLEVYELP